MYYTAGVYETSKVVSTVSRADRQPVQTTGWALYSYYSNAYGQGYFSKPQNDPGWDAAVGKPANPGSGAWKTGLLACFGSDDCLR